jgi:predicted nucleic acid-binding protein
VSRYLLDATPLTAYLSGRPRVIALIDPWLDTHDAVTIILVYGEVIERLAAWADFERRYAELHQLLHEISPISLSSVVLDHYAALRRRLRPPYGPGLIGDIDTLIAATALERRLTIITTDGDYLRVSDLGVISCWVA